MLGADQQATQKRGGKNGIHGCSFPGPGEIGVFFLSFLRISVKRSGKKRPLPRVPAQGFHGESGCFFSCGHVVYVVLSLCVCVYVCPCCSRARLVMSRKSMGRQASRPAPFGVRVISGFSFPLYPSIFRNIVMSWRTDRGVFFKGDKHTNGAGAEGARICCSRKG